MFLTSILTMIKSILLPSEKTKKMNEINTFYKLAVTPYIEKHLELNDPKIMTLSPHELILGVTEILWEEKLKREGKLMPMVMMKQASEQPHSPVVTTTIKKTYH